MREEGKGDPSKGSGQLRFKLYNRQINSPVCVCVQADVSGQWLGVDGGSRAIRSLLHCFIHPCFDILI